MRRNRAFQEQRDAEQSLAMVRCVAIAVAVVVIGTLGFQLTEEQWTYWDAFYFTMVTISTVGYGDYGLSEDGRYFAALVLLGGIATFTYSLTTLVRIASDLDSALRRKMKRSIAKCNNHVIVCGYGRMGRMLCGEMDRSDIDTIVIECEPAGVQQAMADGRLVIPGTASDDSTLREAGVERAQGVVCAVDSDAENMFIIVTAREINPGCRIISRADSPESARKLEHAGASLVISPHQMAGKTIATALVHPRLARFLNRGDEEASYFELGEIVIQAGSNLAGKTVREAGADLRGLVFVAVERANHELIMQPPGDFRFGEGDVVIFAGSGDVVHHMRRSAQTTRHREPAIV